ncbi:unnamed protein product, partial [Dibothriocephalus latus]
MGDGDEEELSDLSSDNSESANLSELAAILRLPPTTTKAIQEIFREGTEVHHWLSKLEDSLYQPLPPVTCSEQALSHAYCRVQHDIPRSELDKCLSELEFYHQKLEGWREDLNNLMTSQRERFERLNRSNQRRGSRLLSGHSSLNFVSDWLDMLLLRDHDKLVDKVVISSLDNYTHGRRFINEESVGTGGFIGTLDWSSCPISWRTAVERELNCQLRWLDLMNLAEHDARVQLRETAELAGPALKESHRLIFDLLCRQRKSQQQTMR